MGEVLLDINIEIPQNWFYELSYDEKPKKSELTSIVYDFYKLEMLFNRKYDAGIIYWKR